MKFTKTFIRWHPAPDKLFLRIPSGTDVDVAQTYDKYFYQVTVVSGEEAGTEFFMSEIETEKYLEPFSRMEF